MRIRLSPTAISAAALLLTFSLAPRSAPAADKSKAEHVVVVVWDGMRPDFITPQYTPTLYKLAKDGVFFKNHHPVYVSSTEVNGTAIATGCYPNRTGIIANSEYDPELGWVSPHGTESLDAMRRGDLLTGGKYIMVPTLAEILQKAGIPTIIAGTKPVALMHDRAPTNKRTSLASSNSPVLFKGQSIPRSLLQAVVKANEDKSFSTNTTHPNTFADGWTTKGLTHVLWRKEVPKYTLLWLSDPDASQHETGPGSDTSINALASVDKNLEDVLKALDEKRVRDKTDVMVVSDHGFSTIKRGPDVAEVLKKAKFKAHKKLEDAERGDIMVVGLGGSVLLYVIDHDEAVIQHVVEFLQGTDFAGVIFSQLQVPGTFPLEQVKLGPANACPDIVLSMRWLADKNEWGTPGLIISDGGTKGKGTHASLSRYDMHNTLVAAGPSFKKGFIDEMPTGNADVAPTILHILGISASTKMDGRVLHEALAHSDIEPAPPETKTIEASVDLGLYVWKQYLKSTTVGEQIYFDEGNGESTLK
jgi:arylsulfatase A-like enzyme